MKQIYTVSQRKILRARYYIIWPIISTKVVIASII